MRDRSGPVRLEIVIPVYNEEEMIKPLLDELIRTFGKEQLEKHLIRSVKLIFVDDGSTDNTASKLAEAIRAGLPAVLIRLSRNFGHQKALKAGLDVATADVTAVIDADLQDPPDLIPDMLSEWREGCDVVYGLRRSRREGRAKRFCYWAAYRLIAMLSDIPLPLDSGDFCLMDRRVVTHLKSLSESVLFLRGMRSWVGFRQIGLPYDRPARIAGTTKYRLKNLYKLATDGIAALSTRPLRLAQGITFAYLVTAITLSIFIIFRLLFPADNGVSPLFLTTYLLILLGNGLICLCIYVLGAYVGRGYVEVKGRPQYVVMEVVTAAGFEQALEGNANQNDRDA
ncbi:MAG: glycosyltransferase family 2 protein [Desulfomonilaceae bacterium]